MKRLFFALWPDRKIRKQLAGLTRDLEKSRVKPVFPGNFHVTLVFLGAVSESDMTRLRRLGAEMAGRSFTIVFDRLEYWRKPKVLCLTSSAPPPDIVDLAGSLSAKCCKIGIQTDARPYCAHVTLARKVPAIIEPDFIPVNWPADSFALVESKSTPDGPRYEVLQSWPLPRR